jgi:hypothetical protein
MNIIYAIVVALVLAAFSLLSIKVIADISQQQPISAQPSSAAIHIIKDATNSYTISSGSSKVGTFDTSYTIMGSVDSITTSKDLIRSTIIRDYDSSPTIGYVKVPTVVSPGANPFADIATINQTITSEIDKAIESAETLSNLVDTAIKCNLGMQLSEWKCSSHGLLG